MLRTDDVHCIYFIGFGRREIVECLLEKGAQVDVKDEGMVILTMYYTAL